MSLSPMAVVVLLLLVVMSVARNTARPRPLGETQCSAVRCSAALARKWHACHRQRAWRPHVCRTPCCSPDEKGLNARAITRRACRGLFYPLKGRRRYKTSLKSFIACTTMLCIVYDKSKWHGEAAAVCYRVQQGPSGGAWRWRWTWRCGPHVGRSD